MGLVELLLGRKVNAEQPAINVSKYTPEQQDFYLKAMKLPQMTGLLSKGMPKNGVAYDEGIMQGLNYGIPELAKLQDEYGIAKPTNEKEISLANNGDLNTYDTVYSTGLNENPREGGLIPDFVSGFKDNVQNRFDISNFEPDKKSIANRFGEAIGTGARFLNSPTGAGLLMAGIAGATGSSPLQAMAYGGTAGFLRRNIQTGNKVYRKQLEDMGVDTSDIDGNITDKMYSNVALNNYRLNNLGLRNKKMTQDEYAKSRAIIIQMGKDGMYSPDEVKEGLERLNDKYVTSNINTTDAGSIKKSNQTRNADVNEYLAPSKKYAYETAPQIAAGNLALNQMKSDPNYQATVAGVTASAKKQAENYNKDIDAYNTYVSKMPELKSQVSYLNKLAKDATYTKAGVAIDSATRQLGLPVGKGAVARTEYTAVINNQILPLLRETFGAQFTEREGEALRQSLGDVNKSPSEKQAVLNAFIKQKEMNIKSQERKVGQYGGSSHNTQPKNTTQRSVSKSGRPIVKVNGVWQYE